MHRFCAPRASLCLSITHGSKDALGGRQPRENRKHPGYYCMSWQHVSLDFRGVNWISHYTEAVVKLTTANKRLYLSKSVWPTYRYLCTVRPSFLGGEIDLERVKRLASWRWKNVDGSFLPRFEPSGFASIVQRYPITIAGDSVAIEFFSALGGLLHSELLEPLPSDERFNASLQQADVLLQPRAELVLRNGGRVEMFGHKFPKQHTTDRDLTGRWLSSSAARGYQILVLLTDSVVACADQDSKEQQLRFEKQFTASLARNFWGRLVVWISTHVGHSRCEVYTRPLTEPNATGCSSKHRWCEPIMRDYRRYCWGEIPAFDARMVHLLRSAFGPRFLHVDARHASVLRADAHAVRLPKTIDQQQEHKFDCLHWCLPGGPIETWADMLYSTLAQKFSHSTGLVH